MNRELPDVQAGFRKGRGSCQHLLDHRKSKSSRKTCTSALLTMPKPLTVWITTNCEKFLKRSLVFLFYCFPYFFAFVTEEGFLSSPCYSLELYSQVSISFPFSLSLLFWALCKASSGNHFAFLHFFFLGMVLIIISCTILCISTHSSSGNLPTRSNHLNLFITSTV